MSISHPWKIIYYASEKEAIEYALALIKDGYTCYMDQPIHSIFSPIVSVDSDEAEHAHEFLVERKKNCTEFERKIIHCVCFTHYPRLIRYIASLRQKNKSAYFSSIGQITCFDSVLDASHQSEFVLIKEGQTIHYDPRHLTNYYKPSYFSRVIRKFSTLGNRLVNMV